MKDCNKKLFSLLSSVFFLATFSACSSSDNEIELPEEKPVKPLPKIENVSLNYHSSEQTISLPRNIETEGATISLKDGAYWISQLKLNGDKILFNVIENNEIEQGHRFDTIVVKVKSERIGTICVSQARQPISNERLVWAVSSALYRNKAISTDNMSGLEITKAIYNLSKTTDGKDSYKNYPAFAYCIEMNHDPENNMEWHLPSEQEMRAYAKAQSYNGTPITKHNYWWTASENHSNGNAYSLYSKSIASRGAESKGKDWWIMAFKNGKMEE